jgi:hypothetical protein
MSSHTLAGGANGNGPLNWRTEQSKIAHENDIRTAAYGETSLLSKSFQCVDSEVLHLC